MTAKRQPRRITAQYLERAALHYLERFATSSENFRRVLMRKVERNARLAEAAGQEPEREAGAALVDALVARFRQSQLLDDALYAEGRVRSLHRRGTSPRAIRQTLAARGVDADTTERALAGLAENMADPDLAAALALARRRRLGPFRPPEAREANRQRDLAALGRAGFTWEVARKVVEAESAEELGL